MTTDYARVGGHLCLLTLCHGFITFVSEPLGKILLIAVDQIVHITFLLPAAYMLTTRP